MDIFNSVCKELPSGYLFTILIENRAACMNITDPNGAEIEWFLDDMPFVEQIKEAVRWCKKDSVSNFTPPRYDACYRAGLADLEGR